MEMTPEQVIEKVNSIVAEKTANSVSKTELEALKNQLTDLEGKSDNTEVKSAIAKLEGLVEGMKEEKISKNNLNNPEIITSLNENTISFLITIEDNGIGFDEAKKNYDEPYFSTKKNGSGLGLSIVSKIIHEHNGQIFYENKTNNSGAIITITLPKINE